MTERSPPKDGAEEGKLAQKEEGDGEGDVATPQSVRSFRAVLAQKKSDLRAAEARASEKEGGGDEAVSSKDADFISLNDVGGGGETAAAQPAPDRKRRREEDGGGDLGGVGGLTGEFVSLDNLDAAAGGPDPRAGSAGGETKSAARDSAGAATLAEGGTAYNRKSPWARGRRYQNSSRDLTVSLHHEICDFVEFIQPVRAETKKRDELVSHLRSITNELWPEARLEVFGSCVTGLQLPCSDVDMVVLDFECDKTKALNSFASVIKADGGFTKIQVIGKAKVPIIKFEDVESGSPLNVCFGQEDGVQNSAMVQKCLDYYPSMRPLVLVLKQFLYNRDLHETYTGGMGSYLLAMTVVSMLQHHPGRGPTHKQGEGNLGALLLEYLQLYGTRFNYEEICITPNQGGGVFPLTGNGGFERKETLGFQQQERPHLLSVQDPLKEDSDIGRNSFNIRGIRLALEQAYWTLVDPNVKRNKSETALGSVLRWDERWESAMALTRIKARATILPKEKAKYRHGGEAGNGSTSVKKLSGVNCGTKIVGEAQQQSIGMQQMSAGKKNKIKVGKLGSDGVGKVRALGVGKKRKKGELIKVKAKKVFVQDGTGLQAFRAMGGKKGKEGQRKAGHKALGKGKGKGKHRSWAH